MHRKWEVTILDADGEEHYYYFCASSAWKVLNHISAAMRTVGQWYGHDASDTTGLQIVELIAASEVQYSILLEDAILDS